MTDHSPEPWKIDTVNADRRVHVSGIYDAQQQCPLTPSPGDWTMSVEDARRITACVNACRGIPTEDLENMVRCGDRFRIIEKHGDFT